MAGRRSVGVTGEDENEDEEEEEDEIRSLSSSESLRPNIFLFDLHSNLAYRAIHAVPSQTALWITANRSSVVRG